MKRILIVTISPDLKGGVKRLVDFAIEILLAQGYAIDVAYYQPRSLSPALSSSCVHFYRKPGCETIHQSLQLNYHAIGARFAEFEFNHYRANSHWRKLVAQADHCLVISGHLMTARVLDELGVNYSAWIASDYAADRADRVKRFSLIKRWIDRFFVAPRCRKQEQRILQSRTKIFPLSDYTKNSLEQIARKQLESVLTFPIKTELLKPDFSKIVPWRFAFVGRLDDPRKNLDLLLDASGLLVKKQPQAQLCLVGSSVEKNFLQKLANLDYAKNITLLEKLSDAELVDFLQTVDVFVVPSYQEGLCIAALEAMACGAAVIATPCGGPLDFVKHNQTGLVSSFDAKKLAQDLQRVAENREERGRLVCQGVELIQQKHSFDKVADLFLREMI